MSEKKTGNEPQSYGSDKDWLTGETGQTVDRTPEKIDREDEHFYHSHRDEEVPRQKPARRSPLEQAEEKDPSPEGSGEDIPRKS